MKNRKIGNLFLTSGLFFSAGAAIGTYFAAEGLNSKLLEKERALNHANEKVYLMQDWLMQTQPNPTQQLTLNTRVQLP